MFFTMFYGLFALFVIVISALLGYVIDLTIC